MNSRLALLDAADVTLTTGIIAGQVTLAAGPDAPLPEWIKVTPAGKATTRDGRSFTFDPARLASRFTSDAIDLAVDTDHSVALLASKGEKPNVVGYVKAVEARQDGTYGRVEWNDPAEARSTLKTHRYVSPTIHHDESGNVTWLHTVALVSAPALGNMPALAHAAPHQDAPMKNIAKALGLAEDATEAACLAALGTRAEVKPLAVALGLPDTSDAAACLAAATTLKAGGGQTALVAELQGTVATLGARLQTAEKTARDKDVSEVVEGALKAKKIVPSQREHYVALCATEDGLKHVRAMLAATPDGLQSTGLDASTVQDGSATVDPVRLSAEADALVAERKAKGIHMRHADAVVEVSKKKG